MSVKLLLTREEACEALGMSLRHFERHVQGHVRMVRVGQKRLVSVRELERWIERQEEIPREKA